MHEQLREDVCVQLALLEAAVLLEHLPQPHEVEVTGEVVLRADEKLRVLLGPSGVRPRASNSVRDVTSARAVSGWFTALRPGCSVGTSADI